MSLVLNTNINSLLAQNNLTSGGAQLTTALQQLSSGMRVNTAADDAAGYAIIQGMTSQVNGINQAARNANDGVSLTQTGAGALQEITNDLQTMRNLAVQSLNATNSATDRADLNQQFQQLSADIDNVAKTTQFNGVNLLDGSFSGAAFQVGANVGQTITVSAVSNARTSALGKYTGASATNVAVGTTGASTIVVNGNSISLGASTNGDAAALAAAINGAGIQGFTATANAATVAGATAAITGSAAATDTITVNGIAIGVTNSGNVATNVSNAITAINGVSTQTGVTAGLNGSGGITLTSASGANIVSAFANVTGTTASVATDYGLGAATGTTKGTVNWNFVAPNGVSGAITGTGAAANIAGTVSSTGAAVSTLDVSSVTSSNTALTAIDAAIQQVASSGAQLGAYQNRFQAAITGLNTTATNLSSARSNIQDTDYAAATAQLAKAQILQQASTSMVAQANTIPQNILTLLQKLP
ncbi:MAG: flagellin [Gammaproteobacteria bacterium]|nr:flagellin [Gammaproteobacteria bacterium]